MDSRQSIIPSAGQLTVIGLGSVPTLFLDGNEKTWQRFIEFFTARIRNRNTRQAYARAVARFSSWCDKRKVGLHELSPFLVAAYIEESAGVLAAPSVKQHLAAIRMLMGFLVVGQVLPHNPAAEVRGPKYSIKRGKTPVLDAATARRLLDSIDTGTVIGLRDRALIGVMVYSFARVSAVLDMEVADYFPDTNGKRWWFRLHEKGGKEHAVPAHHSADAYVDAYVAAAGLAESNSTPLFQAVDRRGQLTGRRLGRREALAMIKRRARGAGIPDVIGCHTFRATGITAYLQNGGTLEHAQRIAAHESPSTTKLYDRTSDEITLDEIERIVI